MKYLFKRSILNKLFLLIILCFIITLNIFPKTIVKANTSCKEVDSNEENNKTHAVDSPILINSTNKKYVYLTFDDGPDPKITPEILDILKKENIQATFFLIGQNITYYKKIFNRIINEGHVVGLHSYTHNLKEVYKSDKAFLDEMKKNQELINSLTGKKVSILRFPGGTFKRMTPSLRNELHLRNYKIYDWHSSVDDGMKPRTPADDLVKNALSYNTNRKNIILLLHSRPNNKTTAEALPKLIKYYKSQGYEFKTITPKTPEYYFYCK